MIHGCDTVNMDRSSSHLLFHFNKRRVELDNAKMRKNGVLHSREGSCIN